jgi:hypothetical protein
LILKESIPSKRINGVVDFDFERINAARTSTEGHQCRIWVVFMYLMEVLKHMKVELGWC